MYRRLPASVALNLTLGMIVDLMAVEDGWYTCAAWCGREVNVRGNFCGHCAWEDLFVGLCIDAKPNIDWDDAMTLMTNEMKGWRGLPINFPVDT